MIRRVFEGFRVPVLIETGMEADDVIATLARRADERGLDVFIVTTDKDARQLIGDHVRLLNLRTKKEMDAAALEKDWGIRPDQVVDFLALTGDSGGQRPGRPADRPGQCRGAPQGVRHARRPARRGRSRQGPEEAAEPPRSRRDRPARPEPGEPCATICRCDLDWDALKAQTPDREALLAICTECGFHGFRDELGTPSPA